MQKMIYSFIIIVFLISCNTDEPAIPVIDITDFSGSYVLHLNDLMSDIRVVKLETSKEVLVPQLFKTYIGEKYIIVCPMGSILQFDSKGNFIRKLARNGNGPGEITFLNSIDVDDQEKTLYVHSVNKRGVLLKYDLVSGDFIGEIKLPDSNLGRFILDGNKIIWTSGIYHFEKARPFRDLFVMSVSGEELGISMDTNLLDPSRPTTSELFKRVKSRVYYMNDVSDTLFVLNGVNKQAYSFVKVNDRFNYRTNTRGEAPVLDILTENKIMLTKILLDPEKTPNGYINRASRENQNYLWDSESGKLEHIEGYYNDFFEIEVDGIDLISKGDNGYLKYSAIDFKEMIALSLQNQKLPEYKRILLEKLDREISVEDNPVFLVGKLLQ